MIAQINRLLIVGIVMFAHCALAIASASTLTDPKLTLEKVQNKLNKAKAFSVTSQEEKMVLELR